MWVDTVPRTGQERGALEVDGVGVGDLSWSQPPVTQIRWWCQVRGGNRVSAGFDAEEVVAEERRATAKPTVGAAWSRHATGAHRREGEMRSGVGGPGQDARSSGYLGK
uniref:DUF834 domain-containing protein n=1 Tax=Oryza nivara TaxID=4536 RepID=A0A0E0FJ88_ORYNI